MSRSVFLALSCLTVAACSSSPLVPYSSDGPPMVMLPASQAGITDGRGRFREIACAVLDSHREDQPNYEPCEQALSRVGEEGGATGEPVHLARHRQDLIAALVPGIGWECFKHWLDWEERFDLEANQYGVRNFIFEVDGLSGTSHNARQIRDEILERRNEFGERRLVMLGYSKGAPDILEAIVDYPEIRPYVAAVVSVAGTVGGSPLAYGFDQGDLDLLRHVPDATCSAGDGEGVSSLYPTVRQAWLADNPLPENIPYYSVVTFPQEDQISDMLKGSYRKLAKIDPRNDSQVLFYDQVIPGSTLVAYLNADHWAVAVPVAESHQFIGKHIVDQNAYPWRAIFESILRFVEEDLQKREAGNG